MGQITSYSAISTPVNANSLLFIADYDGTPQYEMKKITFGDLNKKAQIWADSSSGLKLTDDGGNYGIFIKDGGNVGVGATTADAQLHVSGGDSTPVMITRPSNGHNAFVKFQTSSTNDWLLGTRNVTNSDFHLYSYGTSTNVLTVQRSDGNVGIGTGTPADLLAVNGNGKGINLNFASTSSFTRVTLAEAGTAKAYVQYIGSAYTTTARRNHLELLSTGGISFWPDKSESTPAITMDSSGNLGVGTTSPSAPVHIEGTGTLLYINTTSGVGFLKMENNGANTGYIINHTNYFAIGASTSISAGTHLQIRKSDGRASIGQSAGTFTYPLIVSDNVDATLGRFDCETGTRAYINVHNSNTGATNSQTAVVFSNFNNTGGSNDYLRWMCGSFYNYSGTQDDTDNYFGIGFLGGSANTDPNDATFNNGTLQNTTVYISSSGGINSANTSACFGTFAGDGSSNMTKSGDYNISSTSVSARVLTINFDRKMSNTTYTVVATGYDSTSSNEAVLFGEVTTRNTGSCVLTFKGFAGSGATNLYDSNIQLVVNILGAKHQRQGA
jgi:hypothetical protein